MGLGADKVRSRLVGVLLSSGLVLSALPAAALDIVIEDAYARSSSPSAKSGAVFMEITNNGDHSRIVSASTDAARRVELHTHVMVDGVARMVEMPEGIALPSGKTIRLERGGKHVMMMGLERPLQDGQSITLTLELETDERITVDVPINLRRKANHGSHGANHSHSHGHSQ